MLSSRDIRVRSTKHDIQAAFDGSDTLLEFSQCGLFFPPPIGSDNRNLSIPIGGSQSANNTLEIDQLGLCLLQKVWNR